jgi:hypothetical protein
MTAGNIVRMAPMLQGVALVGHNVGKIKKKKITAKDMIEMGVTNIVGASLITHTAQQASLVP